MIARIKRGVRDGTEPETASSGRNARNSVRVHVSYRAILRRRAFRPSKRFAKRQQMQWTPRGAHLLLQTRTRTLDGTLRPLFERWYPGLANDNTEQVTAAAA